jgi:oligopeptide transport system substrate-binding protein
LTWTFHLRPNLVFSDGTQLTSADVAYSLDRALQPATASSTALTYLGALKDASRLASGQIRTLIGDSILVPDPDTIVLTLQKTTPYFLSELAYPGAYVVEKKLVQHYGKSFTNHLTEGGGDGPFKLVNYVHGQEIDLAPNPNFNGPQPQLQRIIFKFYPDVNSSYAAYEAHQIDTTSVPLNDINQARATPTFRVTPQPTIYYYTMNYLTKPFDNLLIRRAFEAALNRDLIVNVVWRGQNRAINELVPLNTPGFTEGLAGPKGINTTGDASFAQSLFQQGIAGEGWSNVAQVPPITFTYASDSPTFDVEVSTAIQMWDTVLGIHVQANRVSEAMLNQEIAATRNNAHGLQFWASHWTAEYPDPQDWITRQFGNGSPFNAMNYGQNNGPNAIPQQQTQAMMEQADSTFVTAQRFQLYQQVERQLIDDVAWIPMYQLSSPTLLSQNVMGVMSQNKSPVMPPDDWASVYIANS